LSKLAAKKSAIVRRKTKRPTAIVRREPVSLAESIEKALIVGDLAPLSVEQRLDYYKKVCLSLGLNPLTRPFDYIAFQGKMFLYARKDCTDQLRKIHGVSVTSMKKEVGDGYHSVEVEVRNRLGRTDTGTGVVFTGGLKGVDLANAMMKAETKAKRRATLSICGLGFLDEAELDGIPEANGVTPAGRIIVENGKPVSAKSVTEEDLKKYESITMTFLDDKTLALTGNGLNIARTELTDADKQELGITGSLSKGVQMPAANAAKFIDRVAKFNVVTKFAEEPGARDGG
jgi:hypothetical protein